jgi:hypothetical protein
VRGATISIYQPQLESWTGNLLDAYAAVAIKTPGTAGTNYGVIWFTARTEVDKVNRVVSLSEFTLTKQNFPTLANNGAAYATAFGRAMPWTESMPLDELETALSTTSVERQQRRVAVNDNAPRIMVSSTPAVLVSIDGKPALRPSDGGFMKVINSRALILMDAAQNKYYLALMDGWVEAATINGSWVLAANPSPGLDRIRDAAIANDQNQVLGNSGQSLKEAYEDRAAPTVYVSTTPAELILTQGEPVFAAIPGTTLSYVTNTAGDIFRDGGTRRDYVLIGGRWFSSTSLQNGTWSYQPGASLPADFARIPEYSPKADVLVSVPGTEQAKEAAIANQIPQTATISRTAARLTVKYDGPPDFQPITGTSLTYALNTLTPVISQPGGAFYACQTGVWFVSPSATGPWAVATSVPIDIYSIPPASPLHYVTYVQIYGSTPTSVHVGYTPGYYGTVLTTEGVVVYGTGYTYPTYIGSDLWVPAPHTYGVGATFSWSVAAGWGLGFGLGFGAAALGPWWGSVGYWAWGATAPAWGWGGYGGVASSNFYGHWGSAAYAGTRAPWAKPYVGRRGGAYNPSTGVVKGSVRTGNGAAYNGNNLYADRDGIVYRASPSSGWQQHDATGWHGLSSSSVRSSLDRQSFSRGLGSERWGRFNSGGWAGRSGGGFADRDFGGGGFHR